MMETQVDRELLEKRGAMRFADTTEELLELIRA